jgi:hypothetical protein
MHSLEISTGNLGYFVGYFLPKIADRSPVQSQITELMAIAGIKTRTISPSIDKSPPLILF